MDQKRQGQEYHHRRWKIIRQCHDVFATGLNSLDFLPSQVPFGVDAMHSFLQTVKSSTDRNERSLQRFEKGTSGTRLRFYAEKKPPQPTAFPLFHHSCGTVQKSLDLIRLLQVPSIFSHRSNPVVAIAGKPSTPKYQTAANEKAVVGDCAPSPANTSAKPSAKRWWREPFSKWGPPGSGMYRPRMRLPDTILLSRLNHLSPFLEAYAATGRPFRAFSWGSEQPVYTRTAPVKLRRKWRIFRVFAPGGGIVGYLRMLKGGQIAWDIRPPPIGK